MEILNSKAYYLNNYGSRRRHKTEHQPSHLNKDDKISQIVSIRSLNRPSNTLQVPILKKKAYSPRTNPLLSKSSNSTIVQFSSITAPKSKASDALSLLNKERSLLQKVIDQKSNEIKKLRSYTIDTGKSSVLLEAHPLGEVNSIQIESMKPTDRYFHMLENVRTAEKLLLAQASEDCNRKSLSKFYRQQKEYKANITKLGLKSRKTQERSRVKLLNRKKWLD